jgi:D-alanine--poly(phosphoribitol) ligase subunit 1
VKKTFINQAPFSFDLSVFELTLALASGGCLFALTRQTQHSLPQLFSALAASRAHIWVSTPSFAALCLSDTRFSEALLPSMELFLFCGEVLPPDVATQLYERFSQARVVNSYGPTESTVAVTQVIIDQTHLDSSLPLPVGIARPGTRIDILNAQGEVLPPGESGEIRITGNTVARGYFGQPELSAQVFGTDELFDGATVDDTSFGAAPSDGTPPGAVASRHFVRSYRTGDKGYLDKTGMLHYQGRLDFQIKLNGYRIELGDIEENLCALESVSNAVVLPAMKDGRISHLVAYVVLNNPGEVSASSGLRARMKLRDELSRRLPAYMIPKNFVLLDTLPLNINGKTDRTALMTGGKSDE